MVNIMFKILCLFLFLCSVIDVESRNLRGNTAKMVIDQDGGADDAIALFIALLYEEHFEGPEVVGITTVNGNVNETQAFINTQKVLNVAERTDVSIYRGSQESLVVNVPTDEFFGRDGLGDLDNFCYSAVEAEPLQAALALIMLSKQYENELIVVTLGPLTNIALAITLDSGFLKRIKHIYVGAGHIYNEDIPFTTKPEFNVLLDVESYRILTDHAVPEKVTMVPFSQVLKHLTITRDWRLNELGAIPTKTMKALNKFERVNIPKRNMWSLLDPAVMSMVLEKDIVEDVRTVNSDVILCGDGDGASQRGSTKYDFDSDTENINLVYSASKEIYEKFLMRVFSSEVSEVETFEEDE